ncbi:MAG TPA: transketolase C-terminal domain-containing protein [Thermoplasmata archaeon]|jgi:pyruvate/2-oxoacid:ferredoxin oxidoreductase alpha subunit|nr:transketolase C-terminal domain-containing protein [Thermoplasmata archaeon]
MTQEVISGCYAQSYAVRLARVQVISAYPITPQTSIVEKLAEFVADGSLASQYVKVESEHSALQTCVSASALGARTYTATSSQGLLLMHELLHWASGMRTPIVMGVVNRAVAPPWSIGADHTDTMSQRDTGWIQFYPESNQEVLDTVLIAYRLAESLDVRLPVMVGEDAFFLSHTVEPVSIPTPTEVDSFLPPRESRAVLVPGRTGRVGSFTGPVEYVQFRRSVDRAMSLVPEVLREIEREYEHLTGRSHGGPLSTYRTDDADAVLVTLGTATTTARGVVDELRAEGHRVGLAKLRVFRPFPVPELRALAETAGRLGVLDRCYTFGGIGPAATEVRSALYDGPRSPPVTSFLAGIGGRDITPREIRKMFRALEAGELTDPRWIDLEPMEEVPAHG